MPTIATHPPVAEIPSFGVTSRHDLRSFDHRLAGGLLAAGGTHRPTGEALMAAAETISTGVYQVRPVSALKPYEKNARTHSAEQVEQLTRSIREFGFTNPLLVDYLS